MVIENKLIDANGLALEIFATKCNLCAAQSDWQKGYVDGLVAALCLIEKAPAVVSVDVGKAMEWLQGYTMTDTKQVYSSGCVYVPLYRVQQAFEDKAYNGLLEG